MNRRAGSAYSSSSGHVGSASAASRASGAEHLAPAPRRTAARRPRAPTDSARQARAAPTASLGYAAVWPLLMSHSSTVSPGDAAMREGVCPLLFALCSACAMRIGPASRMAASRSRHDKRLPVEQAGREDSAAAARRAGCSRLRSPAAIDEIDVEARLHPHAIIGADLPQERKGLVVTPEQHVLPVVDALARLWIGEGGRAPAKHRLRFQHASPARRERPDRRRRAGLPRPRR